MAYRVIYYCMILLFYVVINSNSTLTVNLESHIMLSCVQPIALFPSSGVIWSKDGVEMSANVRVLAI